MSACLGQQTCTCMYIQCKTVHGFLCYFLKLEEKSTKGMVAETEHDDTEESGVSSSAVKNFSSDLISCDLSGCGSHRTDSGRRGWCGFRDGENPHC